MEAESSAVAINLSRENSRKSGTLEIKKITSEVIPEEKKCPCCLLF